MTRKWNRMIASASLLFAFACGKEEVPAEEPQIKEDPSATASYTLAPSRLLQMSGGWSSGDELAIVNAKSNEKCKLEPSSKDNIAVISTSVSNGMAVFPYSETIESLNSTIKVDIPSTQSGQSVRDLCFCAGKLTDNEKNEMTDLCAKLSFSIDMEGLTSLTIKNASGTGLVGKASAFFKSDGKANVSYTDIQDLVTLSGTSGTVAAGKYSIVCKNLEDETLLKFEGKDINGVTYTAFVEDCSLDTGESLELGTLEFEAEEPDDPEDQATIKKISLVFIDDPNSTTFLWPFETPSSGDISLSITENKGSFRNQRTDFRLPEENGGYTFSIYATSGVAKNAKSGQGFKFGGAAGNYMTIPGIEGMYLVQVKFISGDTGNNGEPNICAKDGTTVLDGGVSGTLNMLKGDKHVWSITNAAISEPSVMVLTKDDIFRAQILEFTYSTAQTYSGDEEEIIDPGAPPVDISTDEIPDFSRVGYHYGDKEIPDVPAVATLEAPTDGSDATSLIQKAIDSSPTPGAILLKAGKYNIGGTIYLNRSGIVLRGEGDKTILYSTAMTQQSALIAMGSETSRILGQSTEIVDEYTHCGQMYVRVADPSLFKAGDKAFIYRPATKKWIHDIHMDEISDCEKQWSTSGYSLYWERTVVSIDDDKLYLDNPIVMGIGGEGYGTGRVYTGTKERINEVGIEYLTLDTRYDATKKSGEDYTDEDHCWSAVSVKAAEHSWVRNITSYHFGLSCVILTSGSKNITVSSCSCLEPVSKVSGGRRYAFNHSSSQLSIFKDCRCDDDRHQFVCGSKVCGPNVFLRCTGTNSRSEAGPHQRWATGILFDNVNVTTGLSLHDRGNYGSGHGWAAANCVLYNCESKQVVVQSPWASAQNWAIGCIGTRKSATRSYGDNFGVRIQGTISSEGIHVEPESLYESQLKARHAKGIYLDKLP